MNKTYSINTIYLHVTKACNLQCNYCYIDAGRRSENELDTEEWFNLVDEVIELKPKRVVLTGGEPLLRHDTLLIAERLRQLGKGISIALNTNGTLINSDKARKLFEIFDDVRISIDGTTEINALSRGSNSFEKVMNAFECLYREGEEPFAFITVTNANFPYLTDTLEFLCNQGIFKIHVAPLLPIGRAMQERNIFSIDELHEIVSKFFFKRFGFRLERGNHEEAHNCGVGHYINIYPDGSIYPCHVLASNEFYLGNVRTHKLTDIFHHSERLQALRDSTFGEVPECDVCMM